MTLARRPYFLNTALLLLLLLVTSLLLLLLNEHLTLLLLLHSMISQIIKLFFYIFKHFSIFLKFFNKFLITNRVNLSNILIGDWLFTNWYLLIGFCLNWRNLFLRDFLREIVIIDKLILLYFLFLK